MSRKFVNKILAELISQGNRPSVYNESRGESRELLTVTEASIGDKEKYLKVLSIVSGKYPVQKDSSSFTVNIPTRDSDSFLKMVAKSLGVESGVSFNKRVAIKAYNDAVFNALESVEWSWTSKEHLNPGAYLNSISVEGIGNSKALDSVRQGKIYKSFEAEFAKSITNSPLLGDLADASVDKSLDLMLRGFLSNIKKTTYRKQPKKPRAESTSKRVPIKGARKSVVPAAVTVTRGGVLNLEALIVTINSRLEDEIASRMHSPALNYQTGRFAGSAKVLSIDTTNKGYPSIRYTYQRAPYDVFEVPGGVSPWKTIDRDPRKIIQASIREIAAGIMKQRFYMRRV